MSATTFALSSHPTYAQNLAAAARNLVSALFAADPDATRSTASGQQLSIYRLYCLACRASSYDSVSPKLAEELRLIAARS